MSPMRSHGRVAALFAVALLLISTSAALASGPSIHGTRGLLRVHSADPHPAGYVSGSIYGLYSRQQYEANQSFRLQPETVKFAGSIIGFTYAPSPYVELAARSAIEGQLVDSEPADFSEREFGIADIDVHVKTLLTPASQKSFLLGAELGLGTTAQNENALTGTWDSEGLDISGLLALTFQHLSSEDQPALRLHLNSGYLNRTGEFDELAWALTNGLGTPNRSTVHGDQFLYGAGIEVPTPQGWTIFTEWSGEYDMDSEAEFMDNPMRVTPGVRWATPSQSFVWTSGMEIAVSNEDSAPNWQFVGGLTFGGYVTPVRGTLHGLVRDADTGEPVSNAHVTVRNSSDAPARSDADGRFKKELEAGYAVLELSAEGYNPKTRVVEVSGHQKVDFDFTLTKRNVLGSVRGRLRDAETGDPLFGRVRVAGTNEWVETDPATGSYNLENVPEGSTDLEIEARNYKSTSVTARVVAGDTAVQNATLERDLESMKGLLSGYIRDGKTGEFVAATVTVRGKQTKTVTADPATGVYEVHVEAGTYNVSVTSPGYMASVETVQVSEKDSNVKNFELGEL
ncbi:MAG TPA: carboxypeptidase regulatory-like domain-containing protein, partial [bacterium]|nr:carboxypeptidase regulatory-like domain-containing protein [bacterium]